MKGEHGLGIQLGVEQGQWLVKSFNQMPEGVSNPSKCAVPALLELDRILKVNGTLITSAADISAAVGQVAAGDDMCMTIERRSPSSHELESKEAYIQVLRQQLAK